MRRAASLALLLALHAPGALALDAFPTHTMEGDHEARYLVRLPEGGRLRVHAEPAVLVAVVAPGVDVGAWASSPLEATVVTQGVEESWHGLPGTVAVVLRREDARQAVRVEITDAAGAGVVHDWPPTPRSPLPLPALALVAPLLAATLKRQRAHAGRMRLEVSAEADAPLDDVWRWWTDYGRPGDEHTVNHGFGVPGKRRVLEADATRVVLAESVPLPVVGGMELVRHEVRIDPDAHRLVERALEGAPYTSTWTFERVGDRRTRIRRELVADEGPGKYAPSLLAKPFAQRDLDHHVKEFERQRPKSK